MSEILAILDHRNGALDEMSGELLAEMREVAQRQENPATVCAVILSAPGASIPDLASINAQGIANLYILAHPLLDRYSTEAYVSALAWLIRQRKPLLVASSATANGRDCMARLAARLRLPYAPGCLSIDMRDDTLFTLRTMYDGRAYIQLRTPLKGRTALATLVPGIRGNPIGSKNTAIRSLNAAITTLAPSIDDSKERERTRHIATQAPSPEDVEFQAAERLVAGGRGIGRADFTQVAAFAHLRRAAGSANR